MSGKATARLGGRPVFIANYRSDAAPAASPKSEAHSPAAQTTVDAFSGANFSPESREVPHSRRGLRYNFPTEPGEVEGGHSDGYCFRMVFAGGRYENSYQMVRAFLLEQGYAATPIPQTAEELSYFRLPQKLRHQLSLFGEDGYVHNPVKILYPPPGGRRGSLILELYHEAAKDHLLRFHRRK
ncbi:hypothetical protein [Lewinella sp. W8]|uniref:hypothetical protein n=1 Tax=Lewinella sp. W8 TaxID=2528208 RepID=UPI001C12A0C2|nr:hypothetical protein [Lewinella sp. W8]